MSVIQYYLEANQAGNVSDSYAVEFQAELEKLQQLKKYQQLKKFQRAKRLSTKINSNNFYFDEHKLANIVQSGIGDITLSSGENYSAELARLYQAFSERDDSSFKESARAMIGLRDELAKKSGIKYSVLDKDVAGLELMAEQGMAALTNISSSVKTQIGNIGESTSSIMGIVLADKLISGLEQKINKKNKNLPANNRISISNISATYANMGAKRKNGLKLQTDNILTITADIGDEKSVILFQLNLSDKASSKFKTEKGQVNKREAYFRGSTVNALSKDLSWSSVANTISYHWDAAINARITFETSLEALRRYYGSRLLLDMFLNKNSDIDTIDFTASAGKLIPESDIFKALYKDNNPIASIDRTKLINLIGGGVGKEKSAEEIVRGLSVNLKGSI